DTLAFSNSTNSNRRPVSSSSISRSIIRANCLCISSVWSLADRRPQRRRRVVFFIHVFKPPRLLPFCGGVLACLLFEPKCHIDSSHFQPQHNITSIFVTLWFSVVSLLFANVTSP